MIMEKKIDVEKQPHGEGQSLSAKQVVVCTSTFWLPLFLAASLTALFAFSGGGTGRSLPTTDTGFLKGLPGAFVAPVTHLDKMGYYDLARRDSVAQRQRLTVQNNYARQLGIGDSNVVRIQRKLETLKRVIDPGSGAAVPSARNVRVVSDTGSVSRAVPGAFRSVVVPGSSRYLAAGAHPRFPAAAASSRLSAGAREPGLGRYEQAMSLLQGEAAPAGDPELRELNSVVEKLLVLQRSQADTMRKAVAPRAEPPSSRPALSVLALPDESDTVGGADTTRNSVPFDSTRIEAFVPEETVLSGGGQLRLQLTRDILVGRQRVSAGTPIYGMASLTGERLQVRIDAIASESDFFKVNLEAIDEDGLAGIYIPAAPVSEALRESAGQELGAIGTGGAILSPTLAGQATNAGMTLARSLIGKKIRPVRVTIPAGYHLLLHLKNAGI